MEASQRLAATLYQAALHIDRLADLLPAVKQIAHKHVSVMVKKEQYPIVGYHLLEAMKEVFGLSEEDDTLLAWKAHMTSLRIYSSPLRQK